MFLLFCLLSLVFAERSQATLCQKYAQALGVTQEKLMTEVVTTVVSAEVTDPMVALFFDGTLPPGSIDFLKNTTAFNRLAANLISYFGEKLGCTDPAFPKYNGERDMKKVHMNMPIDRDLFDRFVALFIGALGKLGVSPDDQSTIGVFLDTFAANIVNPRTICGKYAAALSITEVQLMTTVIQAVVKNELADDTVLPFFNGKVPPGSIDFLTNTSAFNRLAGNLIAFFGGALGCNKDFPPYTGNPSMKDVHARMPITQAIFSNFNNNLQQAVGTLGVDRGDQLTLRTLLDGFQQFIVNTHINY